jgi:hypothetical protein
VNPPKTKPFVVLIIVTVLNRPSHFSWKFEGEKSYSELDKAMSGPSVQKRAGIAESFPKSRNQATNDSDATGPPPTTLASGKKQLSPKCPQQHH